VLIASPGPPHCVPNPDVERVRHKTYFVACGSYRHIENLAAGQPFAALHLPAVLIDNPDDWNNVLFRHRASTAVVIRLSYGQGCNHSYHCQPTSPL
jgi:hypothetical protein